MKKHLRNVERMERSQRRVHGRLCKIMVILKIPSWRMLLNWLLSRHRSAPNCSIASMEKAWKLAKKWWVKIQINIIKLLSEEIPKNYVYICYLQIFNTLSLSERVFGVMMVLPSSKLTFILREALRKKTANFMISCKKVGRWQTQNINSFLKEIMTRGLVPESLVRKFNFYIFHNYLKVGGCLYLDCFVINIYVIIR